MAVTAFTENQALEPGSQLWIAPPLEDSAWTQKIDWYLNLQLLKSLPHKSKQMTPEIEEVLSDAEITIDELLPRASSPLMVAAQDFLPASQVVILPTTDAKSWIQQARQIWIKMRTPATRVFLPEGIKFADVKKAWTIRDDDVEITVVEHAAVSPQS